MHYSTTVNETLKGPESNIMLLQPPVLQYTDEPLLVTVKVAMSPEFALVMVTGVFNWATPTILETPEQLGTPVLSAISSALPLIR